MAPVTHIPCLWMVYQTQSSMLKLQTKANQVETEFNQRRSQAGNRNLLSEENSCLQYNLTTMMNQNFDKLKNMSSR